MKLVQLYTIDLAQKKQERWFELANNTGQFIPINPLDVCGVLYARRSGINVVLTSLGRVVWASPSSVHEVR